MLQKQQAGESLDAYLQNLQRLSAVCDFRAVSAIVHKEEAIRDAFICGMISNEIRQRLLENEDLTLTAAYDTARSLELAQKNAESYNAGYFQQKVSDCDEKAEKLSLAAVVVDNSSKFECSETSIDCTTAAIVEKLFFYLFIFFIIIGVFILLSRESDEALCELA